MKDKKKKTEDASQDPLAQYYEADERQKAKGKKSRKSEDVNRNKSDDDRD